MNDGRHGGSRGTTKGDVSLDCRRLRTVPRSWPLAGLPVVAALGAGVSPGPSAAATAAFNPATGQLLVTGNGLDNTIANAGRGGWAQPAIRGWFALAQWQALNSYWGVPRLP